MVYEGLMAICPLADSIRATHSIQSQARERRGSKDSQLLRQRENIKKKNIRFCFLQAHKKTKLNLLLFFNFRALFVKNTHTHTHSPENSCSRYQHIDGGEWV